MLAAPTPGFDVLLMRSLAVLAPAIGLAAVAAAFVPDRGWEPVLWLLPAFGLTAATLALGTWFPVRWVAWALGAAWVGVAAVSVRGAPGTEMVESFAAFDLAGQIALAAVAVVATVVVVVRRDAFDSVDLRRAS